MSRRPLVMLVLVSLGAVGASPLDVLAHQGDGNHSSAATGDVEVLLAYIDPGVAGFVIVTVLGFISSVGYWARSHIARVKQRLFGPAETTTASGPDDEASADGSEGGEEENC